MSCESCYYFGWNKRLTTGNKIKKDPTCTRYGALKCLKACEDYEHNESELAKIRKRAQEW